MKKACVIGGKGKVGNFLVPMLVNDGYDVTVVTRGETNWYLDKKEYADVHEVRLNRNDASFVKTIADGQYDAVVDMICFDHSDLLKLVAALKGSTNHLVVCGSLWMHGTSDLVPVREQDCREPLCEYGRQKCAMSDDLHRLWAEEKFPGTIVHPGHICAPKHPIVNPQGNLNADIFAALKEGREVLLPGYGLDTLHHVAAEDVAGIMRAVIQKGEGTFGEDFHAAASQAMSLNGYARHVASLFGREANLSYAPFEEFKKQVSEKDAAMTWDHISHSPAASMEKVKNVLGYTPKTPYETVDDSIFSYYA